MRDRDVWFCTGGARLARVFHSSDRGRHWTVGETPIVAVSESAGVFSIAFRDREHGLIVGGDYRKPREPGENAAFTADGGKTWKLLGRPFGYRSCVAWTGDRWVAVGTSGSDDSSATMAKPGSRSTAGTTTAWLSRRRAKVGPSARRAALQSS